MDMCRGSLLAQPWSNQYWLPANEHSEMATFIELLRAWPDCFGNPRFILGNPWRDEPYGYSCSNGERAFLALNNCTWEDRTIRLQLGEKWGLPDGKEWNIYRWYPAPALLKSEQKTTTMRGEADYFMRPFEIVLLEAVPVGSTPGLARRFTPASFPRVSGGGSRQLAVHMKKVKAAGAPLPIEGDSGFSDESSRRQVVTLRVQGAVREGASWVVLSAERQRGVRSAPLNNPARYFNLEIEVNGEPVPAQPVIGPYSYPAGWQAWRIRVPAGAAALDLRATLTTRLEPGVQLHSRAWML